MANLFIAPKIKVGFQKRSDTFTGQLAYIIYYDDKGKIRKEKSWEGWRDKKIAPQEFDNTPMDGFTLNKDVKRYSGDWFSSHRTMIRVHDPRGFEFEVTTENLIGILMHTDCLRRGLIGQFVYAWGGTELVLLPTNSEEYKNGTKYTAGLSKKVKAKELVPGISYSTKREGNVTYIGRFNWYEYTGKYSRAGKRKEINAFVFTKDDGKTFFKKPSVEFLSEPNSDVPVSNLAELVDKFNKRTYANKIVRYEFKPATFDSTTKNEKYYGEKLRRSTYFVETNSGIFGERSVALRTERAYTPDGKHNDVFKGYEYSDYWDNGRNGIRQTDGEIVEIVSASDSRSHYGRSNVMTLEQVNTNKFYDLYVVFENGKQKRVSSIYGLTNDNYGEDNE